MRLGIVTIHHVTNYGAVFQAYALSRALRQSGVDVEIVDYRPAIAVDWYRQPLWKNRRPNLTRHLWQRGFDRFIDRHLPLGPLQYESSSELCADPPNYDLLVAGSDQIWCTGDGSFRGYDPAFFLDFCRDPEVAKFSYAASAGNTGDFSGQTAAVRQSLDEFSAISVRDDRTAELVERTTGRQATVVLDPVFLHDFDELVHDVRPAGDLVIFSSRPERFEQLAQQIARKHRLRIVSLVRPCAWADSNVRSPDPVAWLRAMKGARAILTDYFHGLAISLKFGRPVIADAAPGKANKIADLAERLQVTEFFLPHSSDPLAAIDRAVSDPQQFAAQVEQSLYEPLERSRDFLSMITASQTVGAAS